MCSASGTTPDCKRHVQEESDETDADSLPSGSAIGSCMAQKSATHMAEAALQMIGDRYSTLSVFESDLDQSDSCRLLHRSWTCDSGHVGHYSRLCTSYYDIDRHRCLTGNKAGH